MSQLHSSNRFYSDFQELALNKYWLPLHDNGVGLKKYDARHELLKYNDEAHQSKRESFYQWCIELLSAKSMHVHHNEAHQVLYVTKM